MEKCIRYDPATGKGNLTHRIILVGDYERRGSLQCIDATVTIHLDTVIERYHLGRFCIETAQSSLSGEETLLAGVVLHWKLLFDGEKLCLHAMACKDFGNPVCKLYAPQDSVCVAISGIIAK